DFHAGRDTPRDFLERCLDVIDKRDKTVRAFVTLNIKGARKAADAATKRYKAGKPLSMVDGCPVAIKDIIATADMPTQMNSPAFKDWQSGQDAACVAALRKGGAVIIGKSVTTEFAIGFSGPTTNPFDATRTPGGSSSGTAASVGAGMVPVGLGTQTQASTLRPASFCGAVGYKPSLGQLHLAGVHPLSATCDHLGVIGATLGDVWRTASQISLGIGSPGRRFLQGAGAQVPAAVKPRKLIRLYTRGWTEIDDATKTQFELAIDALAQSGVEIASRHNNAAVAALEDQLMADVDDALDIVAYELRWPFEDYIARFGKKIGERLHGLVKRANEMTPADYERLLDTRSAMRRLWRDTLTALDADGYVTLASSGPAIKGFEYTGNRTFLIYGSWLGLPAFSLPLLQTQGLPFGLQLIGLPDEDGALAGVANGVMRALGAERNC
ncbi:MAG: amidase, partial [Cyanobacteria bacterium K_DeepCast_35m_m2_023]|nr:amidase [Cyanobacteria bacterium K_DeepCast_35m_m2_023]